MKLKKLFLLPIISILISCSNQKSISINNESILILEKPYFSFTSMSAQWNITEDNADLENCSCFIFTENKIIYRKNNVEEYEVLPDGTYQKTEYSIEYSTIEYNYYEYNKNNKNGLRIELCDNPFFNGEFYIENPEGIITYSLSASTYFKVNTNIDVTDILKINIDTNYTF